MHVNRTILITLLWGLPTASVAQTGSIIGRTIEANGSALIGVTVSILGTNRSAVTTGTGQFVLDNVPVGSYSIRAARLGLQPVVRQVVVTATGPADVTIILSAVVQTLGLISGDDPSNPLPPDSLKYPVPDSAIIRQRQSAGPLPFIPRVGQRSTLSLFKDLNVVMEIEQTSRTSSGTSSYGTLIWDGGLRSGLATVVIRGDRITANIRYGLRLIQIRPQHRGIHLIVEVDQSKMPAQESEHPSSSSR